MATEYFDGYHWKNGKSSNIDSTGIDRSVWLEFEKVILEKYNENKIYKRSLFSGATEIIRTRKDQILNDFNITRKYKNNSNISWSFNV